jgi:hypothetical protein
MSRNDTTTRNLGATMYSNDPIYSDYKPVKQVRLWPYVLAGLLVALCLWAYFEPIPEHTTSTTVTIGPNSPLYGPLNTTTGKE